MLTDNQSAPMILVVEDDDSHAELIKRSFDDTVEDYRMEIVATISAAMTTINRCIPNLVLTDFKLPDGFGIELVSFANGACPVVIMTSHGNEQLAVNAIKAGAVDYLVKTLESFSALPHIVRSALREWILIQERILSEAVLLKSEERHRAILQTAMDGIWRLDAQGRLIEVNDTYCRMSGYCTQELLTMSIYDLVVNETENEVAARIQKIIAQGQDRFISQLRRNDGTFFEAEVSVQYRSDDGGQFVVFLRDISDRKKAEEEKLVLERQLHQSQKLESLGVLAGGIAHDFNNILAIIMGYCYLVKLNHETVERNIPLIEKAAERAAGLCRQMLAYAGKAQFIPARVNLWMLVDEMVNMLKSTINQNTVITSRYSDDVPDIMGDASQIRQVVMNLIVNASEAIVETQGEIFVSLTNSVLISGQSDIDHFGNVIPPGRYICLEVTDNGCGMDDETKRRIFEPFYTTKFTGRGLGISAVLGIITAHKGALQLYSKKGQGTTFKVYLPVLDDASFTVEPPEPLPRPAWQGSGTILLVEDEVQVTLIAKTMLNALGFRVIEASNGFEALEFYRVNAADITLVLTDMGMPVMDGYELFLELKKLDPKLPIIISSGYGDTVITSRIPREAIAGLVSKPYGFDQLRDVLKGVLEK